MGINVILTASAALKENKMSDALSAKQAVAHYAAELVEDGMVVGLGTGSTANYFIDALAERHRQGLACVTVASSVVSTIKAKEVGLPQQAIEQVTQLDLYIDGADEVTPDNMLLKGRGSDLVREKILARAAKQFYVLADHSKLVSHLGENYPIPMEVMPFAWQLVLEQVKKLGGTGQLRPNASDDGLHMTTYGSLVLDVFFADKPDMTILEQQLNAIPGLVEHGIFIDLASGIVIADKQGRVTIRH